MQTSDVTGAVLKSSLGDIVLLAVVAFLLAMALTPIYTFLAYRYRFWKKQRTTSTTGEKTEHFIYNPLYPALNIIGRPFADWGFQLKAAWDKKPYLVPVVALLGLPVNILNHVSPFKIDFNSSAKYPSSLGLIICFSVV